MVEKYSLSFWVQSGLIICTGITLTLLTAWRIHENNLTISQNNFSLIARENISVIQNNILTQIGILENIGNFFLASEYVDQEEFGTYTKSFIANDPSFDALGWIDYNAVDHVYFVANVQPEQAKEKLYLSEVGKKGDLYKFVEEVVREKKPKAYILKRDNFFQDIHFAAEGNYPHFIILHPVFGGDGQIMGVSFSIIDTNNFFLTAGNQKKKNLYNLYVDIFSDNGGRESIYTDGHRLLKDEENYYYQKRVSLLNLDLAISLYPAEKFIQTQKSYSVFFFLAVSLVLTFTLLFIRHLILIMHWQKAAQRKAEEASRLKSEFLATISHEIRSPMSGVLGMAELLLETKQTPDQEGYTKTIINCGETLTEIINDILDFSKIEANKIEIHPSPVDLIELVDDICILYSPKAREKALEIAVRYSPGTEQFVYADSVRVRQILGNLINNAIKFTEKGHITVTVADSSNAGEKDMCRLKFSVEDTGIGISAEQAKHIFDAFCQGNSSTTRDYGGTGLGLSISQKLARLMGGEIKVISEPGQGSKFSFSLPFRVNREEHKTRASENTLSGVKILVVDDLPVILDIVTEHLASAGASCERAESGLHALNELNRAADHGAPYDLVIIDYLMPDMNGEELAERIKANPLLAPACLVMLTAAGSPALDERLEQKGFSAYIAKPVRNSSFIPLISYIWEEYRQGNGTRLIRAEGQNPLSEKREAGDEALEGAQILLVEDSRINQAFAQEVLENMGCVITVVSNGREAIEALRREKNFDMILMDCQMPVMDGFEAARYITAMKKSGELAQDIPVIALTANAMEGDRQRCLTAGMDGYLSKPVRRKELKRAVYSWLMHKESPEKEDRNGSAQIIPFSPAGGVKKFSPHKTDDALLDDNVIHETRSIMKDRYSEMLSLFFQDTQNYIEEIEEALKENRPKAAIRPAHTIKSSAARMGAAALARQTAKMEEILKEGMIEDCAPAFGYLIEIKDIFSKSKEALHMKDASGRAGI